MNQQTAQNIIGLCSEIDNLNLDELLSNTFGERTDFENIQLSQVNLSEFIYLLKKVSNQFSSQLKRREVSMILSSSFSQPQFGSSDIESQIVSLLNQIKTGNYASAEGYLLWLVYYLVTHSLFDEKIDENIISDNSLLILKEKLNLIETSIINKQKEVNVLYSQLDNAKKDIEVLILQKKDELSQITTNLQTANSQISQIGDLLNKGTEQSSKLSFIVELQEGNKTKVDETLKGLLDTYRTTNAELDTNIKVVLDKQEVFEKQVATNQEHLEFVEGKRTFFEERVKYLEELIGREVGVSLFETFKQRKMELNTSVTFWKWAVPAMAVITIIWVFCLFYFQPLLSDKTLWWQGFAINSLKSVPVVSLLIFTINQYRKERNFQEEYAFKSAVALTIDAYANRLGNPENKDKLIMEAVFEVYKSPIDTKSDNESLSTKTALESMKSIAETSKELVTTAKDIVSGKS